jgi:hypothetical protein
MISFWVDGTKIQKTDTHHLVESHFSPPMNRFTPKSRTFAVGNEKDKINYH